MTFSFVRRRWLMGAGLCLALCGCLPSSSNPSDEEKEPYFQRGKELVNSLDYKGATEAFEKALEVNPHNALAHFELGLLWQRGDTPDQAAAIYHFERFLQLRPNADQADIVRQRISACKQDLARSVSASLNPVTQSMQRDLEQAGVEKARLAAENRELQRQVEAWRVYYARNPAGPSQPVAQQPAQDATASVPAQVPPSRAGLAPGNSTRDGRAPPASTAKTCVAQRGDSFYSIAKRYGVKQDALIAANPGIPPKKLKAGQTLSIPAP